ncbi:N-acetyl-alpha-D-glucosaminyl L-malate synthase BshA [Acidobacteriia bacterium AH_259_A11_L15]|nr:N-acetyl-alpha-D-glucosaminyl L-malate synthase BshA [Acidobacteriia bacterium AH_259_A11_L15]
MKIGITCYPTYGGSGVVATELGMELAARGHEVHFISYAMPFRLAGLDDSPDIAHRISYHEVEVLAYPLFDYPPYALALASQMAEVAEHYRLDLLHVHYAIPHSVSAYLAQAMLAPRRLPVVTTLHGTDITLVGQDRSFLPITRFAIEQADGVTAVSTYLREITEREFGITRPIEVISNFVNCDRYQRSPNQDRRHEFAPKGERLIAHLSNFRPVKNVPDVIEVFARIRCELPARLLLIGDGPERANAEYLVRERNISQDVIFLGKQDNVANILGVADLFLLPSDLESFGLAALEAMACEVPVIATNVGGLPELIHSGEDGCLVAPRDVAAMTSCALELLREPERGRSMGRRARETARARYCSTLIIPRYEAFYRKLLGVPA